MRVTFKDTNTEIKSTQINVGVKYKKRIEKDKRKRDWRSFQESASYAPAIRLSPLIPHVWMIPGSYSISE